MAKISPAHLCLCTQKRDTQTSAAASTRTWGWSHLAGMEWVNAERKRSSCLQKSGASFRALQNLTLTLWLLLCSGSLVCFIAKFQVSILLFPLLLCYFTKVTLGQCLNSPDLAENEGVCPKSEKLEERGSLPVVRRKILSLEAWHKARILYWVLSCRILWKLSGEKKKQKPQNPTKNQPPQNQLHILPYWQPWVLYHSNFVFLCHS